MKILYIDCAMGASGDMLTAALTELLPEPDAFVDRLNRLAIPGVRFKKEKSVKCGISGAHMTVTVNGIDEGAMLHEYTHEHGHGHHHSSLHDITHIVEELDLPPKVKRDVLAVYGIIADAESHVHGVPVTEIHFHEVGTLDAVADVTAVCLLMNELASDEVVVSPIHVGSGHVHCAHGILPVPAPATAYILRDVPIYGGEIQGELCTPTGAALLKYFAARFGGMPAMRPRSIGYGMGNKDFERPNCVRTIFGEGEDRTDTVLELSCNVDDMTAEAIGFAVERLFECGAYDVYTVPIGMKKNRIGTMIRVMCAEADRETVLRVLFQNTTTIGVRESLMRRYVLKRNIERIETPYGEVRQKISTGYGVTRKKYEYDDLARIAAERKISLEEAGRLLESES